MPNTTSPPDKDTTFMRLPNEGIKAWEAFQIYRDMGTDRTQYKVANKLGKTPELISRWSSQWEWVKRARAYDDYTEKLQMKQAEQSIPLWEKRRQESLEANMELAAKLRRKLSEMLDYPITHEVKDDARGVIAVYPAKWSYNSVATLARTIAELEAGTIAEALPNEREEEFNVDTATIDQLREFVARHAKRREEG